MMTRLTRILLLFSALTGCLPAMGQKKAYVHHTAVPPVIDGIREPLWDQAGSWPVLNLASGTIGSDADLYARWSALWDTTNLYFLAEITDDLLRNSGPNAAKYWIHDCLEIFFDMLNDKSPVETGDSQTDDKYQYRFIYNLDNEPIVENPPVQGMVNASKAVTGGYNIEVSLPWATLKGVHPVGEIVDGRAIGIEIQVADLDNNPMTWMPDANLVWNNPNAAVGLKKVSNFGTMILSDDSSPDTLSPARITDLAVVTARVSSIEIAWTAPGDDDTTGQAAFYEIRHHTAEITPDTWDQAVAATVLPEPAIAGTRQTLNISGLSSGVTHYFAIVAIDEQGNRSPVSNSPAGTTRQIGFGDRTPMDQFIGTNAFIDDPLDKIKVAGFIREYHPWEWDAGSVAWPANRSAWSPSYAGGGWNFDLYYKRLRDAGITVSPCLLGSTPWLSPSGSTFPYENKPVAPGQDTRNPASYRAHADHMFQYAARYGSRQVADSLLKLAPNQQRVSGLGYLRYLENWNEPDRWWGSLDTRFNAEEYAAMGSADRDGHAGTLGPNLGVKNADPDMKLVMAGLAASEISFIEGVRQWCLQNRPDKQFVYDVINIHHYTQGGSPEAGNLAGFVRNIVEYRDQYLPDVEVWITEFGWDCGIIVTPYSCPVIASYSREEVQAQWIVRSYLLLSTTGIDRAAQYMLRDVQNNGATQFETCGLVNQKNDWKPKPSWYFTYTTRNILKNKTFVSYVNSGNPEVTILRYENSRRDTTVYAVWTPSGTGRRINGFRLAVPDTIGYVWETILAPGHTDGITNERIPENHTITLEVTEKPVFISMTTGTSSAARQPVPRQSRLQVWPNPVQGEVSFEYVNTAPDGEMSFRLFNSLGLCVAAKTLPTTAAPVTWQEDLTGLPAGVYHVEIRSSAGRVVKPLIKID